MKKIILSLISLLLLSGCAITEERAETYKEQRQQNIISCVRSFIHEDVPPLKAAAICREIYARGEDLKE